MPASRYADVEGGAIPNAEKLLKFANIPSLVIRWAIFCSLKVCKVENLQNNPFLKGHHQKFFCVLNLPG